MGRRQVTQHLGGPGSSGHPAVECCVQPGAARGQTRSLSACVAVLWAYSNSHKGARWATGSSEVLHVTGMMGINYKNLLYNGVYGRNAGKGNKPCLNRLFHTPTFRIKGWFQVRTVLKFILVSAATRAAQKGCPLANTVRHAPVCCLSWTWLYSCNTQVLSSTSGLPISSLKNNWLLFMCFYLFPIKHCV